MSFLTPSSLVAAAGHGGSVQGRGGDVGGVLQSKSLRSRSSIAAVVDLVRDPVGTVGDAIDSWYERDTQAKTEATARQIAKSKKQLLYLRLAEATSYHEWQAAASELDELEGNNVWKAEARSSDYDAPLVERRLQQLEDARLNGDVSRMLFLIRTALTRDLGNMGNVELYKHSHIGTKDLIERYIDSALTTLGTLLEISSRLPESGMVTHRQLLEQVLAARQAFGRSALLLSGGGTFGMSHNGVLKALWDQRLLPRIISGASAGSIVSAVICTRTDEEIPDLLEQFCHGDLAVFEDENDKDSYVKKVTRFLKYGHLYDISHLTRVMKDILGDMTFQEAYNRTRRILNICVSSADMYELPRLLNYVTAPNVLIWSAVAASCSVPVIFSPASLLAKDHRTGHHIPWNPSPQRWIDGSVDNDLPMTRLAEMFNVNHFIVSQVNPHVIPFLSRDEGLVNASDDASTSAAASTAGPSWLYTVTHLAKGEALYRMRSMAEFGIFPNALTKAASILNQKYSGDITITPAIAYQDFPRILQNPTEEFMIKSALEGERATWPKLSRVRNHCAIELALDDAVQRLRTRVVFSSSQVDLRLGAYTQAKNAAKRKQHRRYRENIRGPKQMASSRSAARPRSMSQNSEPDASVVLAAKGVRAMHRPGSSASGNSIHSAHSERKPHSIHLPSSSVSTLATTSSGGGSGRRPGSAGSTTLSFRPSRQPRLQPQLSLPAPTGPPTSATIALASSQNAAASGLPDISSSGAETSGLYTSDDEHVGEDSDGSATSTGSPSMRAATAPASRHRAADHEMHDPDPALFPHASQPSTPVLGSGYRAFNLKLTPASPSEQRNTAGKEKEKNTGMSGPEMRYKQLFHGGGVKGTKQQQQQQQAKKDGGGSRSASESESRGKGKRIHALGLNMTLPGRRKTKDGN